MSSVGPDMAPCEEATPCGATPTPPVGHRRSVTTDNQLAPLPHIRHEDCKFIDDLMMKYFGYEHSQSQEAPSFLAEELELRADLGNH